MKSHKAVIYRFSGAEVEAILSEYVGRSLANTLCVGVEISVSDGGSITTGVPVGAELTVHEKGDDEERDPKRRTGGD